MPKGGFLSKSLALLLFLVVVKALDRKGYGIGGHFMIDPNNRDLESVVNTIYKPGIV